MPSDPVAVSLDDRVALITGAASGIGLATATLLARCGARVALCDRDASGLERSSEELRKLGCDVYSEALDVREHLAVTRFVSNAVERFARIDILVNNAGGTFNAPFDEVSEGGESALIALNFTSVTHLIRACLPHMRDRARDEDDLQPDCAIVNVTSIEAHRAAPRYATYAAMKAAVANLTKSLALELGARGIRINCVAPDMIPTPGTGPMNIDTPLARRGRPEDVAHAVLFLASPLAAFVTGTTIHVDGGTAAAGGWRREDGGEFGLSSMRSDEASAAAIWTRDRKA